MKISIPGICLTVALAFSVSVTSVAFAQETGNPAPMQAASSPSGRLDAEMLLRQLGGTPGTSGGAMSTRTVELPARAYSGAVRETEITLRAGTAIPIHIMVGSARTVNLPGEFDRATIVVPDVAEIIALSQSKIQLMSRQPGATDVVFSNTKTGITFRAHVIVSVDSSPVQAAISSALPRERIIATAINNSIVLSGSTKDAGTAAQAVAIAKRFVADPAGIVNNIQILGSQQVILRVKVAEVNRTVVRQLGMNSFVRFNNSAVGNSTLSSSTTTSPGSISPGSTLDTFATVANPVGYLSTKALGGILNTTLNALESDGLVKLLAEPNLVTMSGQTANFLAGQQYPIPVVGLNGTGGTEYRNLGVSLAFTPTVMSDNNISLQVMTELSTLGATVGIPSGSGVAQVPIFNTRRATTTVAMPSGGSIAIAGLIQSTFQNSLSGLPGIRDIPILGRLFSSTDFQRSESELVIIVTPYLVEPTEPGTRLSSATDGVIPPSDLDLYFINRLTGAGSRRSTGAPSAISRNIGFITE